MLAAGGLGHAYANPARAVSHDLRRSAGRCRRHAFVHRGVEVGDLQMLRRLGEASRGQRLYDTDASALAALKRQAGVGDKLASCHTAKIDGYVVEGHVPSSDIKRLIAERPDAIGLTVPGMPVGSPGMEHGAEFESYDVLLIKKDGATEVFAKH